MTEEPKSDGGRPFVRTIHHGERTKPSSGPAGVSHVEEISAHVERHFGPVARVFHEVLSDLVHLDVLVVEPTEKRPWYVLVTSGMSDVPMRVDDDGGGRAHAELVMFACPPESFDAKSMRNEAVYWPIRHLKQLARMPHELDTCLAANQTVASDPPEPVAPGVAFCAFAVLELLDEPARRLRATDGTEIAFLQAVPMYREELEWRFAQEEPGALHALFDTPALRVAMASRPNSKGPTFDARVAAASDRIHAGQRIVIGTSLVLVALAIAEVVAADADDTKIRWGRLGLSISLAWWLAEGRSWARWTTVVLLALAASGGAAVIASSRADVAAAKTPWTFVLIQAATPVWLVIAVVLAFVPSVRAFFGARRSVAAAAAGNR